MYFDELAFGMKTAIPPAFIEKEEMLDFARKYDNIPLHTDEEYARKTRFGGLIAPGVMSFLCVWAKYLEVDFFGEELIAGMSTKIEWFRPVFPSDTLTAEAEITNLTKRNEHSGIAEVTINAYNQNNELVLKATTEALLKCR